MITINFYPERSKWHRNGSTLANSGRLPLFTHGLFRIQTHRSTALVLGMAFQNAETEAIALP